MLLRVLAEQHSPDSVTIPSESRKLFSEFQGSFNSVFIGTDAYGLKCVPLK